MKQLTDVRIAISKPCLKLLNNRICKLFEILSAVFQFPRDPCKHFRLIIFVFALLVAILLTIIVYVVPLLLFIFPVTVSFSFVLLQHPSYHDCRHSKLEGFYILLVFMETRAHLFKRIFFKFPLRTFISASPRQSRKQEISIRDSIEVTSSTSIQPRPEHIKHTTQIKDKVAATQFVQELFFIVVFLEALNASFITCFQVLQTQVAAAHETFVSK